MKGYLLIFVKDVDSETEERVEAAGKGSLTRTLILSKDNEDYQISPG